MWVSSPLACQGLAWVAELIENKIRKLKCCVWGRDDLVRCATRLSPRTTLAPSVHQWYLQVFFVICLLPFADDTSITLANNNLKEIESLVNCELGNVNKWLKGTQSAGTHAHYIPFRSLFSYTRDTINTVFNKYMYDKNDIIGWAKGHSETGFSVNDWKSSKTLRKMKRTCRWTLISGWGKLFSKWEKQVSRSAQSQSWLCPFKANKLSLNIKKIVHHVLLSV